MASAFRDASGLAASQGECLGESQQRGEKKCRLALPPKTRNFPLVGSGQKCLAAANVQAAVPPGHWVLGLATF